MQSGVGMGTLEMAIRKTQQAIAKASDAAKAGKAGAGAAKTLGTLDIGEDGTADIALSSEAAAEAIGKLGVNLQKLQGMNTEEQFLALAEAVGHIGNQAEKTNAAMTLWGRSGTQLLPLLGHVDELRARFRALNLGGQTQAGAENALKLQQAYNDLNAVMGKIGTTIASTFVPAVTTLLTRQAEAWSQVIPWIKAHKDLVIAVGLAGVALTGLGTAFGVAGAIAIGAGSLITTGATLATAAVGTLGLALTFASGAMTLLDASAAVMAPILGALAAGEVAAGVAAVGAAAGTTLFDIALGGLPLILGAVVVGLIAYYGALLAVGAAFVGLAALGVAAFVYFSGAGTAALKYLGDQFAPLLSRFQEMWGGLVKAISAGDLKLAAEIAWQGVKVAFLENTQGIRSAWADLSAYLQSGFTVIAASWELLAISVADKWRGAMRIVANEMKALAVTFTAITGQVIDTKGLDEIIAGPKAAEKEKADILRNAAEQARIVQERAGAEKDRVSKELKASLPGKEADEVERLEKQAQATKAAIDATVAGTKAAIEADARKKLAAVDPDLARQFILEDAKKAVEAIEAARVAAKDAIAPDIKAAADALKLAVTKADELTTHSRAGTVLGGLGLAALGGGGPGSGPGGGVKDAISKISTAGTFSASAIFGLGGGGPLEQMNQKLGVGNGLLKKIAAHGRFKIV